MNLLTFAEGPALVTSFSVMAIGLLWRLVAIFRHPAQRNLSEPRSTATTAGAIRTVFTRMIPHKEFRSSTKLSSTNGYAYHIGLAVVVFGYLPHIDFLRRVAGIHWPALPNAVIYLAAGLTIISLLLALMFRLGDPVLQLLSTFDDYFSWFVTMFPVATGMVVLGAIGGRFPPRDPSAHGLAVAIHLLSVELLLVWLPFGKLAHAVLVFVSRSTMGADFARKGTRT